MEFSLQYIAYDMSRDAIKKDFDALHLFRIFQKSSGVMHRRFWRQNEIESKSCYN
jgi:hypothetical protein